MQVAKKYVDMVIQLHEGRNIFLSRLIMGIHYELLGIVTRAL